MVQLTMDLQSSADLLGTKPDRFLEFVQREQTKGVLKLNGDWRVSIFTLADLLNTTPEVLLDLLEDYALGDLLDEVGDDERLDEDEARLAYQAILAQEEE